MRKYHRKGESFSYAYEQSPALSPTLPLNQLSPLPNCRSLKLGRTPGMLKRAFRWDQHFYLHQYSHREYSLSHFCGGKSAINEEMDNDPLTFRAPNQLYPTWGFLSLIKCLRGSSASCLVMLAPTKWMIRATISAGNFWSARR